MTGYAHSTKRDEQETDEGALDLNLLDDDDDDEEFLLDDEQDNGYGSIIPGTCFDGPAILA